MMNASRTDRKLSLVSVLGRDVWTVPAMLRARTELTPHAAALWSAKRSAWIPLSWREYLDRVSTIARSLRRLELRRGDRIGIMCANCPEWDIAELAVLAAGGVVIGLDPHDLDERLNEIASQCRLTGLIVHDADMLARFDPAVQANFRIVLSVKEKNEVGVTSLVSLEQMQPPSPTDQWDEAQPDDPAMIIFTSGTTGAPKGIQYSHRQVCQAVASMLNAFADITEGSRHACWLPLSNLFQRMINLCAIARGAQTYYVGDPRDVMRHVPAIAPHLFIGVPRFFEKLYAGMMQALQARPAWQRRIADWALRAGNARAAALREGRTLTTAEAMRFAVAERLVLRRLRRVLGPNLRYLVSGSAPMPEWLLERFHSMGLLVLEAYGMSENVIPVAANRPRRFRFGTVGVPLDGSEVRIADDGELFVRGPGVFGGYLDDTAGTRRVDAAGFLASGDFATIDADGFIRLTGRKSEVFKLSTGRRVAPTAIESALRQIPYIEHAVIFGANRSRPVAVIALSSAGQGTNLLASADQIVADVTQAIAKLPAHLRPAGVVATSHAFSLATGELTPNLKLRRANIEQAFSQYIDDLFGSIDNAGAAPVRELRDAGEIALLSL